MMGQKINHHFIESILELLYVLKNHEISMEQFMEEGVALPLHEWMDRQNLQTANAVIRFMDEMPGGFLIYRADGEEEIIYANRALLRMFQCDSLQEFLDMTGCSFRGLVYPEDLEEVEQSIWEQISASRYDLDYVEYRIARKDGSIRWIEDFGHFVHTEESGDIFYVFLSDATEKRERRMEERAKLVWEKRQNEQKIKKLTEEYDKERKLINQEYLRRLEVIEGLSVNYESILYADLDTDQILPYRFSSRTEYQFDQKFQPRSYTWFISDYIHTWVHPEDRSRLSDSIAPSQVRKHLEEQNTYYINYRIQCRGETRFIQLRLVNVGAPEQISQIVLGSRLVDEEIRQELEKKAVLEEALNNANLAIRAKNSFLSNMSHDMRTPLNALFGYMNLAQKNIQDGELVSHYLDKMEGSGRRLLDLIDKVLELSWTEANDIELTETESDLTVMLGEIQDTILSSAQRKRISYSLDTSGLIHSVVYVDQERLKQALLHLLSNAVEYTQNYGKVSMQVTETEQLPNHYAVYQFIVQDTGIGIGGDFLEHLFEPFEREKNTTFSGIHGTGLGLTIAKNNIERMGGSIAVNSVVDVGSTFTVTLRLRIRDKISSPDKDIEDILRRLRRQKILLVEDNEINREIETEILEELDFCIETAENGQIAVDRIRASEPGEYGLVLMDIQMPVMDGWEAAKSIRKLEDRELSRIPIIALSADAFESDKRRSMDSGMNSHLTKPMDVPLLLETIVEVCSSEKQCK